MTPESISLRGALLRGDANAEGDFRRAASIAYLTANGELSAAYYELLIVASELAHRQGLLTRAQTLLRRAILIAGQMGSDSSEAREKLEAISRWPASPEVLTSERIVISLDTECRLFGWSPQEIGFSPSAPRPYRWYMLAPASWREQLSQKASTMLETIFARCNARLAAQEPNDANYIGQQITNVHEMSSDEVTHEKWQVASTTWSADRGFVVDDNGVFFPSNPNDFVPMAHLALVTAGKLTIEQSVASLRNVGFSGAIIERQSNPAKELAEALAYYVK